MGQSRVRTRAEQVFRDLRFAGRTLGRTPGFTIVIVACLALGIGANAAVYSWMDGLLVQPYPGVADQARLMAVAATLNGSADLDELSWLDFNDLRDRSGNAFTSFIATKITGATITGGERAERAVGLLVSANYFDALGVRLLMGRGFSRDDDTGDQSHPVVVISYRLWQDRFNADRGVVGRTIAFNGVPHTIVGVVPQEFLGTFVGYAMEFWVPASQQAVFDPSGYKLEDRGARWIEGFARLAPGVSIERGQAVVSTAATQLATDYANFDRGRGVRLLTLSDSPFDNAKELRPMLRVMVLVVAFVLLIVCANVANLLFVRALARGHEMTVRMAIGASRRALIQQVLTEGALLAFLGTACGLALAYASRNALGVFFSPRSGVRLVFAGAFDWRVIVVTVCAGMTSTLLFALAPAMQTSAVNLAAALKSESRASTEGRGRDRLRSALVVVQICLSYVLLVGTGLIMLSLRHERAEPPGFSTDDVLTTTVNLFAAGYDTVRARHFNDDFIQRIRTLPGVTAAALASSTPFASRPYANGGISVDGYTPARDERPTSDYNAVTPGYFTTLGIPLIAGRDFAQSDADTTEPVAIVSSAFVSKYWPGATPLGRRVQVNGRWLDVIGVAKDIKYRALLKPPAPVVYVPLAQHLATAVSVFARTAAGVPGIAAGIAAQAHAIDPNVSPYEILTMREQVMRSTAPQQIAATLVGLFAGAAIALATIGLYGVVAYVVSQSRRELGVRLAIGASPRILMWLVLSNSVRATLVGSLVGALVAIFTTRLLGDLLFHVGARDPAVFLSAFGVMIIVATVASFVPARRAGRIDPVVALRG
jgi:predicted permease